MALIETKYGRTVLKKAKSMMVVPYVYNGTVKDYVLGNDVYDISAIIGDSITLEQSDGDSTTKDNEFTSSPLIEIRSGGKYAFSAQCIDMQSNVLKSMFGVMSADSVDGAVAFHDDFTLLYALVRIRFEDDGLPDVLLPKVQLSSRLFVNQLRTRLSQGNIAGTAIALPVAVTESLSSSALHFTDSNGDGSSYTPYTPVLFVPRGYMPLTFYAKRSSSNIFSYVNFDNGSVRSDISVSSENGSISLL